MKLTDEEIKDILVSIDPDTKRLPPGFRDFARAIEAALSAKQGEQEPLNPVSEANQGTDWKRLYELEVKKKQAIYDKYERDIAKLPRIVPMDTHPAPSVNAKTLTNEQIDELWRKSCSLEGFSTAQFVRHFARAAIAAVQSNASTHELNSANSLETDK